MTRLYSSKADKRKEAVEAQQSNKWSNQYGRRLSLNNCWKITRLYSSRADKKKEAIEAHKSNKWSKQYGRGLSLNNYWNNDKTLFQ